MKTLRLDCVRLRATAVPWKRCDWLPGVVECWCITHSLTRKHSKASNKQGHDTTVKLSKQGLDKQVHCILTSITWTAVLNHRHSNVMPEQQIGQANWQQKWYIFNISRYVSRTDLGHFSTLVQCWYSILWWLYIWQINHEYFWKYQSICVQNWSRASRKWTAEATLLLTLSFNSRLPCKYHISTLVSKTLFDFWLRQSARAKKQHENFGSL